MHIPPHLMHKFLTWQITSQELAEATGYHAASIRRAIKRPPRPKAMPMSPLIQARKEFRRSIGHLPAKEIMKLANVSLSTADRIRKEYKKCLKTSA